MSAGKLCCVTSLFIQTRAVCSTADSEISVPSPYPAAPNPCWCQAHRGDSCQGNATPPPHPVACGVCDPEMRLSRSHEVPREPCPWPSLSSAPGPGQSSRFLTLQDLRAFPGLRRQRELAARGLASCSSPSSAELCLTNQASSKTGAAGSPQTETVHMCVHTCASPQVHPCVPAPCAMLGDRGLTQVRSKLCKCPDVHVSSL